MANETLRRVRFNFGGDGGPFDRVFNGYTDDTYWNGWLNVWVSPDVYVREIRPHMCDAGNGLQPGVPDESILELDQSLLQAVLNPDAEGKPGLVDLSACYTTCEVEEPPKFVTAPSQHGKQRFTNPEWAEWAEWVLDGENDG